jgi:hypothetical protein
MSSSEVTARLIAKVVADHYLTSEDFNGLGVHLLERAFSKRELVRGIKWGVKNDLIEINHGLTFPNPYVKGLPLPPISTQLELIADRGLEYAVLYPSVSTLARRRIPARYANQPYARRLARGAPSMGLVAFDTVVLEQYVRDPRYRVEHFDFGGRISLHDSAGDSLSSRDEVFLDTFGFAFDDKLNRVVGVYLHYLSKLTPQHQSLWHARELGGVYAWHPDYFRTSALAEFPERLSVFQAMLLEMDEINALSQLIGRTPFFRRTYNDGSRPSSLRFLLRPTQGEFEEFVHTLDKMLSENIDKRWFGDDIDPVEYRKRPDGTIVERQKGTITMLDEWLNRMFRIDDRSGIDRMLATLRSVRKLRQAPAHVLKPDAWDPTFLIQQRELGLAVCDALWNLRGVLMSHPLAAEYRPPDILEKVKPWPM